MEWLFWLGGLSLAGIAAFALWRSFSNPVFVAGLISFVASKAFQAAMAEILKPETPGAREKRIEAFKRDEVVPTKQRPHPNEGGHR